MPFGSSSTDVFAHQLQEVVLGAVEDVEKEVAEVFLPAFNLFSLLTLKVTKKAEFD